MEEWKARAIDELQKLSVRRQAADALQVQRKEIEADMISISGSSSDSRPVHGGGNRQEKRLVSLIDKCKQLEKRERAMRERVRVAEKALYSLKKQERTALIRYYVKQTSGIYDLEQLFYVSRAEVYRILNRGLNEFALRMGIKTDNKT